MGNDKKAQNSSRRQFFSKFLSGSSDANTPQTVKMLTAEGKLVEVDKTILEQVAKKKKSSNKEIFEWMKNPSKDK